MHVLHIIGIGTSEKRMLNLNKNKILCLFKILYKILTL